MHKQDEGYLRSHILHKLASILHEAKADFTLLWREMDCCALLDIWDLIYRSRHEPAWRDLWLAERKAVGDGMPVFLAANDLEGSDLLTPVERDDAIEVIIESIITNRKKIACHVGTPFTQNIVNVAHLAGIGAVEMLTAKAFHNSDEFAHIDQFEEYLRCLSEIHGFLYHGNQGEELACQFYFELVRGRKSSIPSSWRRLHHVISKREYWQRAERRKKEVGSTCWCPARFVEGISKILATKGLPIQDGTSTREP